MIIDGGRSPVDLGDVSLRLNRPVGGHDDKVLELRRKADDSYEASVGLPSGPWEATITAPETDWDPSSSASA